MCEMWRFYASLQANLVKRQLSAANRYTTQRTAACHHELTDARLPQADAVLHDATALDTAGDMLDPQPTLMQRLVGSVLRQRQLLAAGFLGRHEALPLEQCEGQEAQILQQPAPGRKGQGVASAMGFSWTRPPQVSLRGSTSYHVDHFSGRLCYHRGAP